MRAPDWNRPNPWANDDFADLDLDYTPAPVRSPPPLRRDGFRRDAFGVPEGYKTTVEVCEELGVSYRQASHWVGKDWIPGLSPQGSGAGRRLFWSPAQVEAARRIRDHARQLEALRADLAACGPHCQHEESGS